MLTYGSFIMHLLKNKALLILLLLVVGLAALAFLGTRQTYAPTPDSLIGWSDWSNTPGVGKEVGGILVSPLNRKIVDQDGSGGQPNPAVNADGPEVFTKTSLTINLRSEDFGAGDSFRLYSAPPVIYDEWRYETPSVDVVGGNQGVILRYYDGKKSEYAAKKICGDVSASSMTIEVKNHKVKLGNDCVIEAKKFVDAHKIFFGVSANHKPWKISALNIVSGKYRINRDHSIVDKGMGLKSYVPEGNSLKIGAAVAVNPLVTDRKYRSLAVNNFDSWTTENDLKPQFVHPGPQIYSFQNADTIVRLARNNGIALHGHALVFGEANPRWMQDSAPSSRKQIMSDHIAAVVGHYRGKIASWDVVNEPLSDNESDYSNGDGLRKHIWYNAMGPEYIAVALRAAHDANPSAKLYINDYGLEADGERWDTMLSLLKQLKSQGVPLDGVGFQAHVYEPGDEVDRNVLKRHMKELGQLGLSARISEIDVHGDDSEVQAEQYGDVLRACLESSNCVSYTTWGITDRYGSTTEKNTYPPQYGDDLLWGSDYRSKKAYWELMAIIKNSRQVY